MSTTTRMVSAGIMAVVLSGVAAGCGNTSTPTPSASPKVTGPVTITFWNEMTGPYEAALDKVIHQFELQHKNITVDDVVVPNDATLEPKLLSAVVGQDPPTISQMNPPWATGFIETGSLVNMNPFIKSSSGFSLAPYYPNLLKAGRWPDGGQYLMPFNMGAAIMYYNKNAFQQAGITSPPTTWNEFAKDAAKLSGNGRQAFAITLVHTYPWLAFFYQAGGNFVLKNGQPNPAAFSATGPAVKALTLWSNMVDNGSAVLTQGYGSQTDFANGTSSILIGTSAFDPYLVQAVANKFPIGIAPLPGDVTQTTSAFGGYLGIFSKATASQQTAAMEFVKYLTSKAGQLSWMENSQGYLPVRDDVASSAASFLATHPEQKVSLSVLPNAIMSPKVAWWDEFSHQVLLNDIEAVLLKKETPAAAMNSAYQQAKALAQKDGTY